MNHTPNVLHVGRTGERRPRLVRELTRQLVHGEVRLAPIEYSADSIFRVFPILCKHNPHFGKTILFNGIYKQALDKIPNYLWQWKLGHSNYSFLIDVLKNDSTIFRMALLSGTIDDVDYKTIDSICSVRTCDILSSTFWNKKLNAQSLKK
mgnify:CR=1 FL=1